jgi:hypothetical protein
MKVDDIASNAESCICPTCPTYDDCMRSQSERLFCSRGATACTPTSKRCMCGECPVWDSYSLNSYYFCLEGAAV